MSVTVPHINSVIVAGRCTHDPSVKYSDTGMAYCDFQLGTTTRRFEGNKPCHRDSYVQVTGMGPTAEFIGRHLRRGTPIIVTGQLHEVTWRGTGGRLLRRVKVLADAIERLEIDSGAVSESHPGTAESDGATDVGPASCPGADDSPAEPPEPPA